MRTVPRRIQVCVAVLLITAGMPAAYILSLGPAMYCVQTLGYGRVTVAVLYRPVLMLYWRSPTELSRKYERYCSYWSESEGVWVLAEHARWELGLDP